MKKLIIITLAISTALSLFAQKETSFSDVTKQLQKGGDLYLYLSTEAGIAAFEKQIQDSQKELLTLPNLSPENKDLINNGFNLFQTLFKTSGINQISGLGLSSTKDLSGIYERRFFLHHYPLKTPGKIWTMFGSKPHSLDTLNFLPADTIIATFTDIDAVNTWNWISNSINSSESQGIKQVFSGMIGAAKQSGIDIDKIMSSIDGEIGLIITMDQEKKSVFPAGSKPITFPEPSALIAIKVKDNTIFNLIQKNTITSKNDQMNLATRADSGDQKRLIFKLGIPFIPGPVAVVQINNYLFIGSNINIIDKALAVQSENEKGLTHTPEFDSLSKNIPLFGNSFEYISPRFDKILSGINKDFAIDQTLLANKDLGMGFFNVSSIRKDGIMAVSNSNYSMITMLFSQAAIIPISFLEGMLLEKQQPKTKSQKQITQGP